MKKNEQDELKELFGDIIYGYSRAQAIEDGVLVDVSETAREAGTKYPTALTASVWADYVEVPEELKGHQDERGRLWDILWMFACAIRSGCIQGDQGLFRVIVAKPDKGDWRSNEAVMNGNRNQRLVTLKAVCGPSDDTTPCITIMRPEED